jgi:NitT/TauT family transport system substrate-binding protein
MGNKFAAWNREAILDRIYSRSYVWAAWPSSWKLVAFSGLLFCFGSADAEQLNYIRIGHFPNITHAQAVYARATGQFEKAVGIPIRWTSFNAGPSAIEALFTDAIDMTFVGPNPAINGYLKSKGTKFVIIAGAASGGAALVIRTNAGINSEKDFNDKTIATPQLGNTQDVAARMWLEEKGYRLKEKGGRVGLVPLSNADQLTMFRKNQIDGAWTVEPWVSRLEIEGHGKVFLEEKSLWPEGRYVTTHLIVNRDFLSRNAEVVKKLLQAHIEVTQQINANLETAGKTLNVELKKETTKSLPDAVLTKAMTRVEFTWDPISASLHKSAESAHRVHFLRTEPNLDGIYDLKLLNEALKEKGLPPVEK